MLHCVGATGAEPYRTHLLKMLQAVADNLCERSGGIVIDRQDFLGLVTLVYLTTGLPVCLVVHLPGTQVNPRDDDSTTAYIDTSNGVGPTARPYRSTTISWLRFMDSASEIVHRGAKRAITINDHVYRVDLLHHVDHAADEHGGSMDRIHAGSLAFMSKPVAHSIGRTNSPTMMQTLLYWGSYYGQNWQPGHDTAPFGQTALDYAPLFRQLRGEHTLPSLPPWYN